ncbi:MAG: SPOR domain-containing protein [Flavobacteriales bacterium]|jgi:hypothetical protein|nr:SPOR domain-containing protein [Flavobacteriales bacterium]MBT5615499.1 SPOR domain-containing protein [Flavobacteriales bacterium]MBT6650366.1 SPOR domain-containing protein [Flavobacteriales bacterium]MDG2264293.1 hypothetical protein [Flavobacteriales bacterium]
MKKILFLTLMFPIFVFSQSDTTFNTKGEIISINQKGVDKLVSKYKQILKKTGGVEGWRIQLIFKDQKEEILPYQIKFTNLYPEIPVQITFDSPNYKLTVGNFRTRNKALKIKHQISKNFPGAYPVPIIIDPDLLEN